MTVIRAHLARRRAEAVIPLPTFAVNDRIRAGLRLRAACPERIEVTGLGEPHPWYLCGCGNCDRPESPTCRCGDRGTHRPGPGVGCTRPGCLCLEPAEPAPRPVKPARVWLGAY